MSPRKLLKNVFRRREHSIGELSLAKKLLNILTLKVVRQNAVSFVAALFKFRSPAWSSLVSRTYMPKKVPLWYEYANPLYWIFWIVSFLYQWIISRPYTSLAPAAPAIFGLTTIMLLSVQQQYSSKHKFEYFYQSTLEKAYKNDDNDLARIALLSLVRRSPESKRYQYLQALLEFKMGRETESLQSMLRLALNDNHWEAATWLVTEHFKLENVSKWQSHDHTNFQQLYTIAAQGAKGKAEVPLKLLYANYLISQGAHSDAVATLTRLAGNNPELHLTTAFLHLQLGNFPTAEKEAELAERYFVAKLETNPRDSNLRFNLAKALVIRQLEQQAAQTLSDGYKLTNDSRFLDAGGEALVAWSNRIGRSEPMTSQNLVKRLELLLRASKIAPSNLIVAEALTQLTIECAEDSNQQVASLREALLLGVSSDNLHFINGTVALLRGDVDKAGFHLELAAKDDSNLPGLLNNMAVALYQRNPPQLDKAYKLVTAALEKLPNHEYIRETRGQILLRQKQFHEAIADLEFALRVPELAKNAHAALAEAYEALGQKEIAASHKSLAGN